MHILTSRGWWLVMLLMVAIFSCKGPSGTETGIQEGYIEYQVEYQGDSMKDFIHRFLPKTMKMYFKNNNTRNSISDLAGVVEFTHIKQQQEGTYTTLVDVFDNQYKYVEENDQPSIFFQARPNMDVQRTSQMKTIAGCNSRKYNVEYKDDNGNTRSFPIYATRDIHIKDFTDSTPFQSVDGVLMEFQLSIYDLPMKLKAKRVVSQEIPEDYFKIPSEYKKVNKESIKKIIELLK